MASHSNFDEDGDFVMVTDENKEQDFTIKQHDGEKQSDPEIYEMKIDSNIRHRYARTVVNSKVQNLNSVAKEVTFSVILPDKAFISEFVMVIGGKEYKAYVKEKEQAKNIYDQAVATGLGAAHVAVSARESNRFTVSLNVEPLSKATFILTYEELLRRKENMYELVINIHPKQLVKDLFINVLIDESRSLKFVKTPAIRSGNEITTKNGDLDPRSEIHQLNPKTAVVKFKPTVERQKELAVILGTEVNEGLAGQFIVQYDVERDPTGGEVLVQGGYFVHFFAPSDVKPMNKHIIFVLDTSGSMNWGQKMSQLKQAMNAILDQLNAEDYFHIIGFESIAKVWNIDDPKQSIQTRSNSLFLSETPSELELTDVNFPRASSGSPENIRKAKVVLTELNANGGTNIYEALKVAMILIEREKFNVSQKILPQPIVMFLTDGDPTTGVVDRNTIISNITAFNKNKAPIFSLSFGEDADKTFLKKLSLQNQGFSRHIYEASDAALQLRNFYKEIASPLLSNIKFEYVPETTSLTKTSFPIHFAGSEIVVSGRLHTDTFSYIPRVMCIGGLGPIIYQAVVEKPVSSVERLWAYLTVQQLLDEREISADKSVNEKKALNLALQYSFVTPVSSLVVVKPNSNNFSIDPEAADKIPRNQSVPFACKRLACALPGPGTGTLFGASSGFGGAAQQFGGFAGASDTVQMSQSMNFSNRAFGSASSISARCAVKKKKSHFVSDIPQVIGYSAKPKHNTLLINAKIPFKVNAMQNDEKYCVVCFDEIRLKKSFGSTAQFEGLEKHEGEKNEVDRALVFYIRGLLFQWGIPFCYFLSSGPMKADILKDTIIEVLLKLQDIGLYPRVLTCNHSINNRDALSKLGASLVDTAITVSNLVIHTCYHVPHLLNSLRNNIMNTKLQILVNGNQVAWSDIVDVYELNKKNQISHGMQKISDKHIQPTLKQKKRVQYSSQIFSKTVAAAINSAIQTNQLVSYTASHTALFIGRINDIFDVLNSKDLLNPNPQKCALTVLNLIPFNTMQDAVDFFTSIQVYNTANKQRKYVYSISGFIWTIKSVLQLWETLQRENKHYILTGRLNLDPLQSLFLQMRHRSGTDSFPTSEEFQIAFEENVNAKLNEPVGPSNYEAESPSGFPDEDDQMEEILSDYSDYDE